MEIRISSGGQTPGQINTPCFSVVALNNYDLTKQGKVDLSSEVEHIDLTAAATDGSQIADLLSSYDKANAETQTAAIKVEHEAEAASSKEEEEEEEEDKSTPTGGQGG